MTVVFRGALLKSFLSLTVITSSRRFSSPIRKMAASGATYAGQNRYLFYYAQEHVEFRFPEVRSLCKLMNIPLNEDQLLCQGNPFLLLDLPSEKEARMLVERSVLMKSCYECWLHTRTMDELLRRLANLPVDFIARYNQSESSFRLRVSAYGKKLLWNDINQRIEALKALPLDSKVDLKNPTHSFHLMEDYCGDTYPACPPDLPEQLFFGRWIADSSRDAANVLRLDERYFIGTTSMDPLLALVMSNQALVTPGSLVYDPFVGTGSLLVAAAHFGGFVLGGDIDKTLLHGRGKSTRAKNTWRKSDESVLANFKQYGLQQRYLDVMVANATTDVFRDDIFFDAIISDPPYGVREPIARVGNGKSDSTREDSPTITPSNSDFHLGRCTLNDLIVTLINLAAKHLRLGGRLVYWLPVLQDEYHESAVPQHDCFSVLSNCEQPLAGSTSRRLITMEKIKPWNANYDVTFAKEIYSETFRERYFTTSKEKEIRQKNAMSRKNRPSEILIEKVPVCQ